MSGSDFENRVLKAIRDWVGDDGAVMYQNQSFQMQGGKFQMEQKADVLVDSSEDDRYLGFEAKTRDATNAPGMYFSKIDPEQFHRQLEYERKSGRRLYVVFEIRNYRGADRVFVNPITLFSRARDFEVVKVSWKMIDEYGVEIGDGDEIDFNDSIFERVNQLRSVVDSADYSELVVSD